MSTSNNIALVRTETPDSESERAAIRDVHLAAFGRPEEADLVDRLRADGHALVSLVAELGHRVVGHVLFSRMWIRQSALIDAVALAPVAVLPEHQREGIGARLIEHGLDILRIRGERIVIVVGHAAYYPRFGFSADKAAPLASPFPAEAFMAMELTPGALEGIRGPVVYPPPFEI